MVPAFVLTPTISTASPLPQGEVGAAYSVTLAAFGGVPPYTWSLASGSFPPGLSIAANGHITGTPTSATTANPVIQVKDSNLQPSTKAFALTTIAGPIITTGSLPNGTVGTPYSFPLAASGGTPPYSWSMTPTPLDGLTLASNGVLSGTPTTAETISGTFTATDALGVPGAATLPITVQASGAPITVYHGQTLVLNFAGTGSKDHAATIQFDQQASGPGALSSGWSGIGFVGGGAFTGADAIYNPANQAPGVQASGTTVNCAHQYGTAFYGATVLYNPPGSSASDPDPVCWMGYTKPAASFYSFYTMWWQQDHGWLFDPPGTFGDHDNNMKHWVYSDGTLVPWGINSVTSGNTYYYLGCNSPTGGYATNTGTNKPGYGIEYALTAFDQPSVPTQPVLPVSPDTNGHSYEWPQSSGDPQGQYAFPLNPCANGWIKREYRIKWATDSTGYIIVRDNGQIVVNYHGQTLYNLGATQMCEAWGLAYTRDYGGQGGANTARAPQNALYMEDMMYDRDTANTYQVYLHSAPTLAASGVVQEVSKFTSWVNGAVSIVATWRTIPLGTNYFTAVNDAGTETAAQQVTVVAVPHDHVQLLRLPDRQRQQCRHRGRPLGADELQRRESEQLQDGR